jgi:DNA-binding response OmpR family regulator
MTDTPISETVLLVDTDPLQRSTVAQYLRECGYRVIEATNAAEAIVALTDQDIDVLVTDLDLKDASGFQLSARAKEMRPGLKVVVTHSAERTAKVASGLCDDGPLDHPYHPQHLVERIRRLRRT